MSDNFLEEKNKLSDIWRLVLDSKRSGKENMLIDSQNLSRAIENRKFTPVLRFYDWIRPTISLGYGQKRSDIDYAKCERDGIDVVIRPTGGRAVFHVNEITYSIVIPAANSISELSILESYRLISNAFVRGFRELGLEAEISRGEIGMYKSASCFSSTSRYEVVFQGKKLIGSAQRRKKGALLQQGSIPLDEKYLNLMNYYSNIPADIDLNSKSSYIYNFLDKSLQRKEIIEKFLCGFKEELSIKFLG